MAEDFANAGWRDLLMTGELAPHMTHPAGRGFSKVFSLLPGNVRCRVCDAPFDGTSGKFCAALGVRPSSFSMQLCGRCELRARGEKTGAHVAVATLFADIRGSTEIAQEIGVERYWGLIDRFYTAATDVLVDRCAIIEQLVGDQVAAIFVPGLAGKDYVAWAVEAAIDLQVAFGATATEGPWVPVGIGIDAGEAFVGVVGTMGGMTELTVLGDVPNRTARLAGAAASGEILLTNSALALSGRTAQERRTIDAKGFIGPLPVAVLTAPN